METRISSAAKEVIMGQGRPTVLIGDAAKVRPLILAADVIVGRDKVIRPYIDAYRILTHTANVRKCREVIQMSKKAKTWLTFALILVGLAALVRGGSPTYSPSR